MAQEFTKEQIFNMSDEEFNKHFNELMNTSPSSPQANEPLFEPSNEPSNEPLDNKVDDTTNQKVDESTQNLEEVKNQKLDNEKKLWNNIANVNQKEPITNKVEGSEDITANGESKTEGDSSVEEPKPSEQRYEIKSYGQKYSFTIDELKQLAPKALHFTKKLQKIAPYRRTISAMEENGITEDDINQFIEMKKGNKTAISNFLSKANIDAYDLTQTDNFELEKYKPLAYGREQNELTRVIEDLEDHPQSENLKRYLYTLDQESKNRIQQNPTVLEVLMSNIENGIFDIVSPEANKRAFLDGNKKPMIEYYAECVEEYYKYLDSVENAKRQQQQQSNERDINDIRNKTKMTGNTGMKLDKKPPKTIKSASDITLEELEAFEKEMGFI